MRRPVLILAWLVVAIFSNSLRAQPTTRPASPAAVIPIHGPIDDYTSLWFHRRLDDARAAGAKTIIVELNTPGGLVDSTMKITRTLRSLTDLRTIAYVNHHAYSAGAIIAVAADEIAMTRDAAIGDAAPIMMGPSGLQTLGPTERAKAASPILADLFASAQRNGYDPLLLEAMVRMEPEVYLLQNDAGDYRVADTATQKKLVKTGQWKLATGVNQPVDSAHSLLTVHTPLALKIGLAKLETPTVQSLAADRNLNIIARYDPTFGDKIVAFLNDGAVRAVLMTIFLTCLYLSFNTPGHGLPEVLTAVSLALFLGVPLLTGYAQWWEIVLIFLGIGLLAVELFVIPGFGVAGLLGIGLILFGILLTFVAPEPGKLPFSIPTLPITWTHLREGLFTIVTALVASLLLCWWLSRYLPSLPYFNRLLLTTAVGESDAARVGSLTNIEPDELSPGLGAAGTAVTDLRPGGSAEFRDPAGNPHIVSVVCDSGFVPRGSALVVREVHGNRIVVRPRQES